MQRRGLGRQLFGWFVGSVTIPLAVVAVAASLLFNGRLERSRTLDVTNTLTTTAHRIENDLTELDRIAFSPYLYREIFTMLVYADHGYLDDPPPGLAASAASSERTYVNTLVKMMFTASQTVESITFYPANGDGRTSYALVRSAPGLHEVDAPGYRETSWYIAAATAEKRSVVSISVSEEPSLAVASMIRDQDLHRDVGVLRIGVSADSVLSGLGDVAVPPADRLLLADATGRVIEGAAIDWQHAGSQYTAVEVPIATVGWRLVYLASRSEAQASTVVLVALAIAIALATSAVAYAIYRRESRAAVAGTNDIIRTLRSMRAGDLGATSAVEGQDWLGQIAGSVNHLGHELSVRIDQEYKAVIDRQNAEYRALQAQISPHFLYNVFNDFMAMNRLGQRERLEESILRMTRLLRYSCSTAEFATVEQEVGFAREYLFLRQIQLDGRLTCEIETNPACSSVVMPRLIVQPLVENAVKHGLLDDRPLHVTIRTEPVGEGTRITITDNGSGFDPERITETSGFATMNIRERLRILSPLASLSIDSLPGQGTTCVLDLKEAGC